MKIEYGIKDVPNIVKEQLLPKLKEYKIFTFTGPLGSGKTTLIKELLKQCGFKETVTSPSFTYLNIYEAEEEKVFHHFDLYLLKDEESFTDIGFGEILFKDIKEKNNFALIEWPELIKDLLEDTRIKHKVCNIYLTYITETPEVRIIDIITK